MDGNYAEALSVNRRALQVIRSSGDRINTGQVLIHMAILAGALDDFDTMGKYAQESYAAFQAIGSEFQQPFPERLMGHAALRAGDPVRARELCLDSIQRNLALGEDHVVGVYGGLILLAEIELAEKNDEQAARLFGFFEANGATFSYQEPDERARARLKSAMRGKSKAAQKEGRRMALEQFVSMSES